MAIFRFYPAKKENVRWIEKNNIGVLLNPDRGVYHKLNEPAMFLWNLCDGTRSLEYLAGALGAKYGISEKEARRDTGGIIEELVKCGLLKLYKNSKIFYPVQRQPFE